VLERIEARLPPAPGQVDLGNRTPDLGEATFVSGLLEQRQGFVGGSLQRLEIDIGIDERLEVEAVDFDSRFLLRVSRGVFSLLEPSPGAGQVTDRLERLSEIEEERDAVGAILRE